jgi:uncharacterized protein (TIGR00725 family)
MKLDVQRLKSGSPIVTVFGSAAPVPGDLDFQLAQELGRLLAMEGYMICNGGYGGIMEASARGAKEVGGMTIGVVTETFSSEANPFIDHKISTTHPSERLLKLVELGDAYLVLRGSTGTLVELATVWEYMRKCVIDEKPIILIGSFWTPVINTLKSGLLWEGSSDVTRFVSTVQSPEECIELLKKMFVKMKKYH